MKTLIDALRSHSSKNVDNKIHFLSNKLTVTSDLSHADLEVSAKSIAVLLQQAGLKKGDRAVLIYNPGLNFLKAFFGCLFAGVIAVPCYPPVNNILVQKLLNIIGSAKPKIILTEKEVVTTINKINIFKKISQTKILGSIIKNISGALKDVDFIDLDVNGWVKTDGLSNTSGSEYRPVHINEDDVAFLQFTSGSTGFPKGVIITHKNLIANLDLIVNSVNVDENDVVLSWLPPYHDMGLIGGILIPLSYNLPGYIMSPITFLQKPFSWLSAISQYGATLSPAPNFAYSLCLKKISDEQVSELNLSKWKAALNGAEPINHDTMNDFIQKFSACGFNEESIYPCYGMAESTLFISGRYGLSGKPFSKAGLMTNRVTNHEHDSDERVLVSCGNSADRIIITSQTTGLPVEREIGEICVTGESVTQGYWNNDNHQCSFVEVESNGDHKKYFKTGDLGFIADDELFITGRIKDLIIINGVNHYPHDIEDTLYQASRHVKNGKSAAVEIQVDGTSHIALIVGVDEEITEKNSQELISKIKQDVYTDHHLSVYCVAIVPHKLIHKTTSGKIERNRNKLSLINKEFQFIALSGSIEGIDSQVIKAPQVKDDNFEGKLKKKIHTELASIAHIDPAFIEDDKPFSDYGLDSLMVVELVNKLEDYLQKDGYQLSINDVYDYPSITLLCKHIACTIKSL